jgi:ACR3 family arsenite efflux pump ArsB
LLIAVPLKKIWQIQSVVLFLVAPFVLSFVLRRGIVAARGRDYFFGSFKEVLGEVKLWTFVAVIVSMFLSQEAMEISDLSTVGLLIAFLIGFFVVLFILAVLAGRLFNLTYEDNATLAFATTARNSEVVIGVAMAAFPGHPLVYLAIIFGPIVELPVLLVMASQTHAGAEALDRFRSAGETMMYAGNEEVSGVIRRLPSPVGWQPSLSTFVRKHLAEV